MAVFKTINNNQLKKLNVIPLSKERDLQKVMESNLDETLGLKFLASEYTTTSGGRIDTLAVDSSGAPVIIEYKKNRNDAVINQALSYLKWLRTQKSEFFEKLIIDKLGDSVSKEIGLDWNNPRVICIAESFSRFDIDTIHFVSTKIELLKYRIYDDGIFTLEPVNYADQGVQVEAEKQEIKSTVQVQNNPSVDGHLEKVTNDIKLVFGELRERILSMDELITETPRVQYVGYKVSNNFAEVHFQRNSLKIHLRPINYDDPKTLIQKTSDRANQTMNRFVYLTSMNDIDYVCSLIEQSYKDVL
jgi:predicted transport protein